MQMLKATAACLLGVLAFITVVVLLQAFHFSLFAWFAPAYEQVRRNTFEQSQSYNEGMLRDLDNIRDEYEGATTPGQREALRATALHRFAAYPIERLPADLRNFYSQLRAAQ